MDSTTHMDLPIRPTLAAATAMAIGFAQDAIAAVNGVLTSSAELALEDARSLNGVDDRAALRRALTSMRHSVGIAHPLYKRACKWAAAAGQYEACPHGCTSATVADVWTNP